MGVPVLPPYLAVSGARAGRRRVVRAPALGRSRGDDVINLIKHIAGAVLCRLRYGRNGCPHVPGVGTWREW